MRKRGLIFSLAVLAPVVVVIDRPPKPGVTVENFTRLHKGMEQFQIEDVMGGEGRSQMTGTDSRYVEWQGQDGRVIIEHTQGCVADGYWVGNDGQKTLLGENPRVPVLNQFRRWLGL